MGDNRVSRRMFLKVAASTVAVPYVITTSALGASALGGGGKPAASERLVMGCIGMGGQGTAGMGWRSAGPDVPNKDWVPKGGFMARGVHVVAVCDVNKNNLKRAKSIVDQEYGNIRSCWPGMISTLSSAQRVTGGIRQSRSRRPRRARMSIARSRSRLRSMRRGSLQRRSGERVGYSRQVRSSVRPESFGLRASWCGTVISASSST